MILDYFSVYHSGMYVLGSVLGWAILARYLPNNSLLKTGRYIEANKYTKYAVYLFIQIDSVLYKIHIKRLHVDTTYSQD